MRFLQNLHTGHKFALLGLLAALAITLPCGLYARLAWERLQTARLGAAGVPGVTALYDTVRLAQEHRGLSNAWLSGTASAGAARRGERSPSRPAVTVR